MQLEEGGRGSRRKQVIYVYYGFFWGGDFEVGLPVFDRCSLFDGGVFDHGDSGIWNVRYSVNGTPTLVNFFFLRSRDENSAAYVVHMYM